MKNLVIFDIDNTLIKGYTYQHLIKYLYKKRVIGLSLYLRIQWWFVKYKFLRMDSIDKVRQAKLEFLRLMAGYSEKRLDVLLENFLKEYILVNDLFCFQVVNIFNEHKQRGNIVIINTTLIEPFARLIKKYLDADYSIGTRLHQLDNKYTGKLKDDVNYGEQKVKNLQRLLSKYSIVYNKSYVYTDHSSDSPLMSWADYGYLVVFICVLLYLA